MYFLTDAGRRALAAMTGTSFAQPSARGTLFVEHALAIADVALAFRRSAMTRPGHAFISWDSDSRRRLRQCRRLRLTEL